MTRGSAPRRSVVSYSPIVSGMHFLSGTGPSAARLCPGHHCPCRLRECDAKSTLRSQKLAPQSPFRLRRTATPVSSPLSVPVGRSATQKSTLRSQKLAPQSPFRLRRTATPASSPLSVPVGRSATQKSTLRSQKLAPQSPFRLRSNPGQLTTVRASWQECDAKVDTPEPKTRSPVTFSTPERPGPASIPQPQKRRGGGSIQGPPPR